MADEATLAITHLFKAPVEAVWQAFTEGNHLRQWWGPRGFEWIDFSVDCRPGGRFHYGMRGPGDFEIWCLFLYHELEPQRGMRLTSCFSNPDGEIARAPFGDDFPLEVMNEYRFESRDGVTEFAMEAWPHKASEAEAAFYSGMHESMRTGFAGTLGQLEEYLPALDG